MMLPVTLRQILPGGMLGLFALFILLMMLSTDDTRLFSAAQTIAQDCVLPFMKDGVSPEKHVLIIRLVVIFCGLVWFAGSFFMAQLDYVNMFVTIMTSMWIGAGPMMLFGLYSKFGNTKGAFTSLISGMVLALSFIYLQRNWADVVYPFIEQKGWVAGLDSFLRACSGPFEPYIVWRMSPTKFPINSYEINFIIMLICLFGYIFVSLITFKKPYNLDRLLHRGIYDTENKGDIKLKWSFKTVFSKLIGITPEFSFWDKVISWSVFFYSIVWSFFLVFIAVLVWNAFQPWPQE
jgi:Na+/proline symporter